MTFALILRRAIDWFYRRPFSRVISETVFRYGACGAITLSVDAVSYALIYHFLVAGRYFDLGFVVMSPHIASLVLVFPITFFTGFWLNRYVAFRTLPVAAGKQLGRYLLTVVGSILLNYACMKFLVEVCGLWPTPSKCITSLAVALYSIYRPCSSTFGSELSLLAVFGCLQSGFFRKYFCAVRESGVSIIRCRWHGLGMITK